MPELSIIMPLYNTEMYVAQAIQSLLSQTYTDFELIIVDDGSTDKSLEIVKSFKDSRIKIMRNQQNQGIVFSRNRGLKEAVGEYIAPFDSDDIAMPDKFRKQIDFLKTHPDFGLIGSWIKMIDENGKFIKKKWRLFAKPEEIPAQLLFRNYFAQSSVVIRREALPVSGYENGFSFGEDYRMWIDIAKKYKMWNYPECLLLYRVHSKNTTSININNIEKHEKMIFEYSFKFLNIEIDENSASILQLINNEEKIMQIYKLKEIEKFLILVLSRNADLNIYDQKQLQKVVVKRWLKVCFKERNMILKFPIRIISSPLNRYFFK